MTQGPCIGVSDCLSAGDESWSRGWVVVAAAAAFFPGSAFLEHKYPVARLMACCSIAVVSVVPPDEVMAETVASAATAAVVSMLPVST